MRWIAIPAGRFMMGAARGKANQRPAHRVKIGKFWITRAEITAGQYSRCFSAGFCKPAGNGNCNYSNNNNNKKARQDHPTNCLGLRNARRFCAWIGGRLPSEAEWEYAARGGGKNRKYPWGKVEPTCDSTRVKMKSCGASGTAPVCSTPAGNTPHGLCDMAGNVAELVADAFHQDYNKAPADGSAWDPFKNTPSWTARGGSWASSAGSYSGVYRMVSLVGSEATTGFRCARSSRP